MKKGIQMTPRQKEQRFRATLKNQAEKMFSQQTSQPHQQNSQVELLTDKIKNI